MSPQTMLYRINIEHVHDVFGLVYVINPSQAIDFLFS